MPVIAAKNVRRSLIAATLANVLVVALLLPSPAWASCKQDCRTEQQTLIDNYCGAIQCFQVEQACLANAQARVTNCIDNCATNNQPGKCTLALECVKNCQAREKTRGASCNRGCTTGNDCRALIAGLRHRCVRDCRTAPSTTATPLAAGTATHASPEALSCQRACVEDVTGGCFGECRGRCDGNPKAEAVCFRSCRDFHCDQLKARCDSDSDKAQGCCAANGSCPGDSFDEDGAFVCEKR